MRPKSKWTPGSIVLWLIAAVVASFIVCSRSRPAPGPSAATDEVEIDVEVVE